MLKKIIVSTSLILTFVTCLSAQVGHAGFNDYDLKWDIQGDKIIFRIRARTRGWVGIGLSENRGMNGSELMVCGGGKVI